MVVPCRRATRTLFALVAAVAVLCGGGALGPLAAPVRAADPPADPLAGPFVDVAPVASPNIDGSLDSPPLLLAVRAPNPETPESIQLEMLGKDTAGWRVLATRTVATGLVAPGPGELIQLDGRLALITSDEAAGRTFIGLIEPDPTTIRQVQARIEGVGRAAIGAVDVDGDGSEELILAGAAAPNGTGGCLGSSLVVLSGETLARRLVAQIPAIGLDGGAIGRFEATGGDDLVAYSHDACEPGVPATPSGAEFVDLATGRHQPLYGPGEIRFGSAGGPLLPLLADLDGDGVDEPILRSGGAVIVLDPAQAWKAETIATDAIPLAVVDPTDRPRLAIEEPAAGEAPPRIALLALGRVGHGGEVIERGLTGVSRQAGDSGGLPIPGIALASDPAAPAPAWAGDLPGTGCLVLLVPTATFRRCPADPTAWSARPGPAWLQTVPLAAFGAGTERRLLIAAGVGWSTSRAALAVPAPAATHDSQVSRWRAGPSAPFALAVVDPVALADAGSFPAPAISVDPSATDPTQPRMFVHGQPGNRIFATIGPTIGLEHAPSEPLPSGRLEPIALEPGQFLMAGSTDGHESVALVPIPGQSVVGTGPGLVSFRMVAIGQPTPGPFPAPAWTVSVLGLSAYGDASPVLSGQVVLDVTGPSLVADPPFVSLPWPFRVPLRGRAEPGARIGIAGGTFVDTAPDGSFALDVQLAPWPQDLTIEAVDSAGNWSTEKVSLVGGLDYRQLPWQAIVIVAVLLGAGITSFGVPSIRRRSGRVGRGQVGGQPIRSAVPGSPQAGRDDEPEIEDLPAGRPSG